ncbi:hypothetical protein [Rhodoligotrophos defluvii]|uniref:hypothetical protein n=1 Tax=Rhodoligotrophos defluvii TaxID=2561934 RepID=UPI0010C96F6D|nr:hypothetical protein [Rhodoligotrophos defluvii]
MTGCAGSSILERLIKMQPRRQKPRKRRGPDDPIEQRRRQRQAEARRRRSALRYLERGRTITEPAGPLPGWQLLVTRMEPGQWYGVTDLYPMMQGYAKKSVRIWVKQKLFDRGYLERAFNADFDPRRHSNQQYEPRYVYRIAARALAERQEWLRALGMCDGPENA